MSLNCFVALIALSVAGRAACDQCPGSCACKWKSGKQTVECRERGLIMIPEGVNADTQVLDLSDNNLQILPGDAFARAGLTNLQRAFFENCRIGRIDDSAFRGLTNLVELDLSHNLLTSIPTGSFRDVPFLRDLVLSHNPISKIEPRAFQPLPGLIKLDLSSCEIQTVSSGAFDGIEMLESLKLNGNRLSELGMNTVESLQLHGVELYNNPWHCDCRLRPIKHWLVVNNIPYSQPPTCGGPERVIKKTFNELHVDDFACKPEILPVNRHIETYSGNNATILCKSNAIPPPLIKWYWNGKLLTNNSLLTYQKVLIYEEGNHEKRSRLVLPEAQDILAEFYCVSENRAGSSEVNFTLRVAPKLENFFDVLTDGKIASLSAFVVISILFVLLVVFTLLLKLRNKPVDTKTPGVEVVIRSEKSSPVESCSFGERFNPVQKPPREIIQMDESPTGPDLINDTKTKSSESLQEIGRSGSGEYSRNSDSLYPSGVWKNYDDRTPIMDGGSAEELGCSPNYPVDYGLPIVDPRTEPKGMRVWQKGAVPVLPPVSALKRALISSRCSPDEGYQEGGCGTDV